MEINSKDDAITYVTNSGVLDWDWGVIPHGVDPLEKLATYIWHNTQGYLTDDVFNDLLRDFISLELKQEPGDYGL